MDDHDAGPWAGMYENPDMRRAYLKHRSWATPILFTLALIAAAVGVLVALSGAGQ